MSTDSPLDSSPASRPQPAQVGPYRIERQVGAGGMGTVYYGVHVETGKPAAIKVLPASLAREPGFVARFNREIEALRKVQSPHIVELYESGVDEHETYFYAMEFVQGETLTDRLAREKRIPWRDVIDVGVQICRALKAAHNSGVIHRDLKPSNLMLTPKDFVKLTDFGVAQVFAGGKLTVTGGVIGTAEYMSPEQAQGQRVTKHSDIYALGVVMYVMLTGRPPFIGRTAVEVAQKHRYGQFDSPRRIVPEIPRWLDEVVCRCLEKKPEDRYPDAYVLQLRLEEIPRKVDLAANDERTIDVDGAGPTAETLAAGVRQAHEEEASRMADIGGTFIRDLVRAEVDNSMRPSGVGRLLDNLWVLLFLLALVIWGGVWAFLNTRPDPQALFDDGVALMSQEGGWRRAKRECFEPLLELDPSTWSEQVQPYLNRIAVLDMMANLERAAKSSQGTPTRQSELADILESALRDIREQRIPQGQRKLQALEALLGEQPEFAEELTQIRKVLQELEVSFPSMERPLLKGSLEKLKQLEANGPTTESRALREHIITLYGPQSVESALDDLPTKSPVTDTVPPTQGSP
ncbi:MAG: protein kinase [Planctomycetaceae bacterium]